MELLNVEMQQAFDAQEQETMNNKDPMWEKLIQSNDPKDRESLNSIAIKIIDERNNTLFASLLDHGYKIDVLNGNGQTALHYAFCIGRSLIVKTILNSKLFQNDSSDHTDSNGLSHLHIACSEYHANVLELIKKYLRDGSDVNARYHSDPKNRNSQFTPLHFAVENNKFDIVELLLENGANINAVDFKDRTPLHLASQLYQIGNVVQTVELLVTRFHSDLETRDERGDTPLLSMFNDYRDMELDFSIREAKPKFDVLLKNGANITASNHQGDTVLHLVIKTLRLSHCHIYLPYVSFDDTEHAELVKEILENNGELLEAKNNEGQTPLQLAVLMTSAGVVKALLDCNADVSCIKIDSGNEKVVCYPEIVPDYDVVHNIMTIVRLLNDREFQLNLQDHLIILKFLVHEVDSCHCSYEDHGDNMLRKTFTVLEHGTKTHAKEVLGKLEENYTISEDIMSYLWKYHSMMKEAKFYLDKEIEEILVATTLPQHSDSYVLNENGKKELTYLKSDIKLKNGMMLYDLMIKHPHAVSHFFKNDNFDCKHINDFVQYKGIIEGFITKVTIRNYVLELAYVFLPLTPLPPLPDLCNEIVFSFLSNVDIFNLCATAFVSEFKDVHD